MDSRQIFDRVESIRIKKGLSVYAMSEKAGISHNTYGLWKTRGTLPTVDTLEAICDVLEIPLVYLFTDVDENRLDAEQLELLSLWKNLTPERKKLIFLTLKEMQK